jgi:hypothetical protein
MGQRLCDSRVPGSADAEKRVGDYARPPSAEVDRLPRMNAVQAVISVCGSLGLATAMIAMMIRANRSERRSMERRREVWIAGGCEPKDRPNFYSGSGGDSG